MAAACGFLLVASVLLISSLAETCYGVTFSSLNRTLLLTASPTPGQVLKAGEDQITVAWSYNKTFPSGTDSTYKTVVVKLCYAPISQLDRAWRKTQDNLEKDKTCQFKITSKPYSPSNNSFTWAIEKEIPTATYFIRAYAINSRHVEAAYGQTTDAHKATNLFQVQAISGRHASLDIASVCFSAFSILSLFGFFYMEKRRAKLAQQK
ncbi:high-affinity nitrate transporter 3.1-like [Diospyros lotus]|uniref:high-affinity nitrate transporter 3.1-like n=1 Tax=Diospyros lotus TaxID=55363 RepID=UPI002252624C|nr:high-affinity nitrate transporter 3.1-like [Diospyros lotus]